MEATANSNTLRPQPARPAVRSAVGHESRDRTLSPQSTADCSNLYLVSGFCPVWALANWRLSRDRESV